MAQITGDLSVPIERSHDLVEKVKELKARLVQDCSPVLHNITIENSVLRSLDKIDEIKFQMI